MREQLKPFEPVTAKHTTTMLMFEFGKFCTMNNLGPPTADEFREMLTQEGFGKDEIEAAVANL